MELTDSSKKARSCRILRTDFHGPFHEGLVQLRLRVFVEEQKVPQEMEIDDMDKRAVHCVALDKNRVIGTLRIVDLGDAVRIGRLCVDKAYRRAGIATALMQEALAGAKIMAVSRVILDAQVDVIGFYERFGFAAEGDIFDDGGIDHQRMTLALPPASRPC